MTSARSGRISRHVRRAIALVERSSIARFASWGVVNTIVDFVTYLVLRAVGLHPVPANFLSTTAGLIVSFLGNSRWVFQSSTRRRHQLPRFVIIAGLGIWGIQPLIIMAFEQNDFFADFLGGAVGKVVAIMGGAVWNYLMYSRWVFSVRASDQPTLPLDDDVATP